MRRRQGRKKRGEAVRELSPHKILILTEGKETEENYFKRIKSIINEKYRERIILEKIDLEVKGVGKSTSNLVMEAVKRRNRSTYSDVWIVFDKDDFKDFDESIYLAKKENINVAWSNECFELWLLLHFQTLSSSIPREDYKQKLNHHFKSLNINDGKYEKNIKNIFDITQGFLQSAINRSEKLLKEYPSNTKYSVMNPCTTVHNLLNILKPYI